MQGVVVKSSGSVYGVRTNDGAYIDCRVKGNFRLKGIRSTNPVAVGDIVKFDMREDGTAYITDILERKNYIVRKASNLSKQSHILAANLDICFLVVTISHPTTATTFIDRFLASAEAYRVPVAIVFNKTDIYNVAQLIIDGYLAQNAKLAADENSQTIVEENNQYIETYKKLKEMMSTQLKTLRTKK